LSNSFRQIAMVLFIMVSLLVAMFPAALVAADGPAINGKIAFSTNRDGNWEVYTMNPDGSNQTNVSNNPARDDYPCWSPDGTKIAFETGRHGTNELYIMNADGSGQTRLTTNGYDDENPCWSPDGTMIAFESELDGDDDIHTIFVNGSGETALTHTSDEEEYPNWSPDGTKITFDTDRVTSWEIYIMNADGSNQTRLTINSYEDGYTDWSPDGSKIAFASGRDTGDNFEIYIMNADGSNVVRLTNNAYDDGFPCWSPDGTKIAFESDRDGNYEIYIMNADGSDPVRLTNNNSPDYAPKWQPLSAASATLTLAASAGSVAVDSTVTLLGTLAPARTGSVTIYENINGSGYWVLATRPLTGGSYSISFSPNSVGVRQYYAVWPGDSEYGAATSQNVTVNVTPPLQNATLTIQSSKTSATTLEDLTLSGSLTPARPGTVTVRWTINGSGSYTRNVTLSGGQYSSVFGVATPGTWAFKATWAGDAEYNPAESSTVSVTVTQPPPQTANFTFALAATMDYTGNVLTVDGTGYPASQLPKTFAWDVGTVHTFAWASPVSSASTTYTWASTSGQSAAQSGTVTAVAGGATLTATYTGAPVKSGCFIATATYGSASAPQVQALRDFRDGIAMKTFAGSSFMTGFLTWYYSWSPPVADTIAPSDGARAVMRVALQPLLSILDVAASVNSALSFSGEFAIVSAGFAAASLIGIVYFLPLATLALVGAKRYRKGLALPGTSRVLLMSGVPWAVSVALIVVAEMALSPALMVAATIAFVALTIIMVVGTASIWLASFYRRG